ncbi:MAG: hypothetical protein L6Q78_06860 [Bacteroidia bacterium]|nr:hypothetical protein [Bacteroidia bacterium]
MNTPELKAALLSKISTIEDESIIEGIKLLVDFELEEKVVELSEKQKSRIKKAKQEYLNSEILDEQSAYEEIEKWLDEK